MKSKLIARRTKKATVLMSTESMQDAIGCAHEIVSELQYSNPNDPKLDDLEKAASFLQSILTKSPTQMQQEGASTADDYCDDAGKFRSTALKIKQCVDEIAALHQEVVMSEPDEPQSIPPQPVPAPEADVPADVPVMASGSDNWVMGDQTDVGIEAKVPRVASKTATGEMSADEVTPDAYPLHFAIADHFGGTVKPFDQYQGPYISVGPDVRLKDDADPNGTYALAPKMRGLCRLWITSDNGDFCYVYNESNDKTSAINFPYDETYADDAIAAAEEVMDTEEHKSKQPDYMARPGTASAKKAATMPAPAAPAATAPIRTPQGGAMTAEKMIAIIPTEMILKIVEDLPKRDDFQQNKELQDALIYMTGVLKNRPVEQVPVEGQEALPKAAACFGGLKLASPSSGGGAWTVDERKGVKVTEDGGRTPEVAEAHAEQDDETGIARPSVESIDKFASPSSGGGAWTDDGHTGTIIEDGGRTPEIGKAHGLVSDKTGIKVPPTEPIGKFAGDMTANKAVKLSEKVADTLKGLFLEAKPLSEVNDSRPVREAVDSIYAAYKALGEATKLLNKQMMQEEAEEKAVEVKATNKKSSLFGLTVASASEFQPDKNGNCTLCGKPETHCGCDEDEREPYTGGNDAHEN